ncbi:hypothetical protein TIFTF001_000088 [Ficus carica]|uniref:glutathione transferase n=1 Tax=Ficus carica TaxID=3494 RepID=A0AA87Z0R5_FICCA|nr:hypothetical protein TIFTF001_000088 [Ficus carica]
MEDKVVLLDFWPSVYGMRVRIALAEKGIEYEAKEENLWDKSPLLLGMNPVHKTVPVLIHNGKPVCESLNIIRYIDEVWSHKSPLLPSNPYQKSQALFWADYIDKKIFSLGKQLWNAKGEEQEAIKKEFIECLKIIEGELGDKLYFGGERFGFIDLVLVPITRWFYSYEVCANFSIESECPKIVSWARRCLEEKQSLAKSLPDPQKIYGSFVLPTKEKYGI